MANNTLNANDASFHGVTISASLRGLIIVLGLPEKGFEYKWVRMTLGGSVFTVYPSYELLPADLKEDRKIEWRIGGQGLASTSVARDEIASALERCGK